jgi:hypothetical protein
MMMMMMWSNRWNDWQGFRRKPAPEPICPPQIPHDLTWTRIRAATVGSRRLRAWATARPRVVSVFSRHLFRISDKAVLRFLRFYQPFQTNSDIESHILTTNSFPFQPSGQSIWRRITSAVRKASLNNLQVLGSHGSECPDHGVRECDAMLFGRKDTIHIRQQVSPKRWYRSCLKLWLLVAKPSSTENGRTVCKRILEWLEI